MFTHVGLVRAQCPTEGAVFEDNYISRRTEARHNLLAFQSGELGQSNRIAAKVGGGRRCKR